MENTIKLYSFNLSNLKTYLFAAIFVAGNLLLPQLVHLIPNGGLIFLPIYFFTLIAAYKYGIHVGLLTAILSPLVNSLLFGMPPMNMLPIILIKSVILAIAAAMVAKHFGKISFLGILLVILAYQIIGTGIEWAMTQNFFIAIQDFRIGLPGMVIQLVGGYFVLKAIAKI
ncbi:MAG TPA: ECF transporter S component [Paludibacteraceae bacterium]|nr:ECF transporter S component [Paludibacteraceae bacterium]HOL00205.1 ECF transporter S component [Paludibacteraceae bacterium]HPC26157.1 ECF transporter S component [Paludibacteraceae bacterium]HPO67241.1 ECF transporter S component [Paludibacteraceae bacterium]HRU63889.1 ECF transporter S component [Paludibacteraceae bacterium]